jgi:hypothetical protein
VMAILALRKVLFCQDFFILYKKENYFSIYRLCLDLTHQQRERYHFDVLSACVLSRHE